MKKTIFLFTCIAALAFLLVTPKKVPARTDHREFKNSSIAECADCHRESSVAPNHGADFIREHRLTAEKTSNNCIDCHDQAFCLDCHKGGGIEPDLKKSISRSGEYMPRTHRSSFISIHSIKAKDNPQNCYRCHDANYCDSCHDRTVKNTMKIKSHLPSGSGQSYQWNSDHGAEARRSLQSCQSCHPDAGVCLPCHSAKSGIKVNPHPASFKGDRIRARSEKACKVCHFN